MDRPAGNEIQFLQDVPTSSDEFQGGAHDRVASALVDILMTSSGGRAIGLEGSWGSGKSSVIDIATKKLNEEDKNSTKKHIVFVFDAWAHQGDPTLRVFLDQLISRLDSKKIIHEDYWEKQLEKLRSRKKTTTETRSEKLTFAAKIAILLIPLFPIAYLLAKTEGILWKCVAGAILAAPYIALIITWLSWRDWDSKKWCDPKDEKKGQTVLWAFTKQTDESITEQLIRDEEATTIEFNEIFDRLVKDATGNDSKLIIVLDNLDRLPAASIREIWAVMRNFFAATPGSGREASLKNVWLVVPFDRDHIEAVFLQDGHIVHPKQNDETLGSGFIDKTFDIVLRVSPPLVSNWKQYLQTKLHKAFDGTLSAGQLYKLFKLFDLDRLTKSDPVTPRKIKAYVNAIVAQTRLWHDVIPIEYQALYVLNRSKISRDIASLQQSKLLDLRTNNYTQEWQWPKYLAAAHFNVSPDEALEILLSQDIEKALIEPGSTSLLKLQHTRGFEIVLHSVIMDKAVEWGQTDPSAFFAACEAISKLEPFDQAIQNEIWDKLALAANSIVVPISANEEIANGVKSLITNSNDIRSQQLTRGILSLIEMPLPENQVEDSDTYYTLIAAAAEAAQNKLPKEVFNSIFSEIKIPGAAEMAINVAFGSASGKIKFNSFKPQASPSEIAQALSASLKQADVSTYLLTAFDSLLTNPKTVHWPTVVSTLSERLNTNTPPVNAAVANRLLNLLETIELKVGAKNTLKALADSGVFHAMLQIGQRENDGQLVADALAEIIRQRGANTTTPASHAQYGDLQPANSFIQGNISAPGLNAEIMDRIAAKVAKLGFASTVLKAALLTAQPNELFRAIFRTVVSQAVFNRIVVTDVLSNYSKIEDFLGASLTEVFTERFSTWDIEEELKSAAWAEVDPRYIELAVHFGTSHAPSLIAEIKNHFANFSAGQWSETLAAEDNRIALLLTINEQGGGCHFGTALFDALKEYSGSVLQSGTSPKVYLEEWPIIIRLLDNAWKTRFFAWLRDRILEKSLTADRLCLLGKVFGSQIFSDCEISTRSEEAVRSILDILLANGDSTCLNCIDANLDEFSKAVKGSKSADREMLSQRIHDLFQRAEKDEERSRVRLLATKLEIPIVEASKNEEQSEADPPK